jgi:hypothetical protein
MGHARFVIEKLATRHRLVCQRRLRTKTLVQAFLVPALRKLREERGTRFVGDNN